jgi:uncharacterized RDD family membrane protein YckC
MDRHCFDKIFVLHPCQTLHHSFRLNDITEVSYKLSTMSAAQPKFERQASSELPLGEMEAQAPTSALKLQAAERLAAHRARRNRGAELPQADLESASPKLQPDTRAARIAAAVAERYAQSQSYRAFLAAEAERAIEQAQATAEIATRTARAVVATQQQLLSELEDWNLEDVTDASRPSPVLVESSTVRSEAVEHQVEAESTQPPASFTVRLYEDVGRSPGTGTANAVPYEPLNEEDRYALDDEIDFRRSPGFAEFLEPAMPLPANLIEFPRQLVAARKVRPRLAEGPLREDADSASESAQLRIFEVEANQVSIQPLSESTVPEWSSILLSASPASEAVHAAEEHISFAPPLLAAPLGLRFMATIVDGSIIAASFLAFTTVVAYTAGQLPTGQNAAIGTIGTLAALALGYQLLFFTLSDATPGMRYARIGLCSFSDENPSRSAMRRRLVAILLAACPLGLGFLWALLDDERLGWHDRISRMYQRSY